jgi:hypothetical protein
LQVLQQGDPRGFLCPAQLRQEGPQVDMIYDKNKPSRRCALDV